MNNFNNMIFYHIYPLGFCGAPFKNDNIQAYRLNKLYKWIPHIKNMNFNALYLGPIFKSVTHGYDTTDYYQIDNRLGDNKSFSDICNCLHENNIKIILDGVFNHVGREFFAFKDVLENREKSKYCSWFSGLDFNGNSEFNDGFSYDYWNKSQILVKLNLKNPDVCDYLLNAVNMWIDEFDIDGIRLDAADCIDIEFFQKLRRFCKSKKSDFWLKAELTHDDYRKWVNEKALDSSTNYELHEPLYSSHNSKNYFKIAENVDRQFGETGIYKNLLLYNFADNHDISRIANYIDNKNHLFNIYTIIYTINGIPSVYYGSEFGIEGKKLESDDSAMRPCLDLELFTNKYNPLTDHIKQLGAVRLKYDSLKKGDFHNVLIKNQQWIFKRKYKNQNSYIILNSSDKKVVIDFVANDTVLYNKLNYNEKVCSKNNNFTISLEPYSSKILINTED